MEKELKNWKRAGEIAAQVMSYARRLAKPGISLLELAEKIEERIAKLGAKPAFPINLSLNEVAAHCSPQPDEENVAKGLLKIDLGIRVDGALSDLAISLDLSPNQSYVDLVEAPRQALQEVLKVVRPGIALFEIGRLIADTISLYGLSSVRNLSGHELRPWQLHAGLTIPNWDNGNTTKLKEGMILAIEPFATSGVGLVKSGKLSGIYQLEAEKPVRDQRARALLDFIKAEYRSLPFSARWLLKRFGTEAKLSLRLLEQAKVLHHFRQLVESSAQPVAQAEHTVLITEKGCEILTEEK